MNKKGFAVTGIIYTLMVIFIILIITLLSMFGDRKNLLDELKERVLNNVNTYDEALTMTYGPKTAAEITVNPYYEYSVKVKGYYNFNVMSADGSTVKATFYLREGEKVYIKVGSKTYNSGKTEISFNDPVNQTLVVQNNSRYTVNNYENRLFIDVANTKENNITEGKVIISYSNNKRQNTDLNRVRYVKECLYANSANEKNEWSEIMVIKNGLNYALDGTIIHNDDLSLIFDDAALINDGNIHTKTATKIDSENKACVTIDLGKIDDIDYIYTWHNYSDNRTYYEREIMVSGDNENYRVVDNYEVMETEQGIRVSAYEQAKVLILGDEAFPMKKKNDKTWIRLFHHNNRGGTILWVNSQVLAPNGYKAPYKVSGLSFLDNFIRSNGYYELMLEYPELGESCTIIWQQKNNFVTSNSPGTYIGSVTSNSFSGLQKSNYNNTVISSTNNNYHIGALHSTNNGIMGPNRIITSTVDLWVRVN